MAITYVEVHDQTVINNAEGVGGSGDYTSSSFSTTASRLLVLTVSIDTQGGGLALTDVPTPTTSGLTWSLAGSAFNTHTDGSAHILVYLADNSADGSITVAQSSADAEWDSNINGLAIEVYEVAGAQSAATIIGAINRIQTSNPHSGSGRNIGAGTVTLPSATASTSIVHHAAAADMGVQTAASSPAGYTELQDVGVGHAGLHCSVAVRNTGSTSTSVAWTDFDAGSGSDTFDYASIAFEIPETGGTGHVQNPIDALGITDTVQTAVGAIRTVTDALGLTDDVTIVHDRVVDIVADQLGLTDSLTTSLSSDDVQNPVDTLGITDSVVVAVDRQLVVADNLGLTDAAATALAISLQFVDALGLADSIVSALGLAVSATDQLSLTDSATTQVARVQSLVDALGLTDSVTVAVARVLEVTDSLGITDTVEISGVGTLDVVDNLGMVDSVQITVDRVLMFVDVLGLTDAVTGLPSLIDICVVFGPPTFATRTPGSPAFIARAADAPVFPEHEAGVVFGLTRTATLALGHGQAEHTLACEE